MPFIGEEIEVQFDRPPLFEKSPPCPSAFTWRGSTYKVVELLEEWNDFRRRGRMKNNMRPEHAARAVIRGSLGNGRFYFRVFVDNGQIFELYYDRAFGDSDDRKGHWFLVGEWSADEKRR